MKKAITICILFAVSSLFAQMNIALKSHINYMDFRGVMLNGIWGYTAPTGNEYAIVGTRSGVSIVSLADPENPVEVYWHQGLFTVWREVKIYGHYAYISTEAPSGLLIIDLSPLPNNPIVSEVHYTGPANNPWQSAHSLYIDEEEGYCYIFGANRGNGGAIILDIATDPMNPIEVGVFDNWYVHDGFARGNRLYLAHILNGFFSIVDVSDKSNPVLIATKNTPLNFTHNIWPSDDNQYLFTTDEVAGAFIAAYDISDPNNIVELDRIQSNPGLGIVPHNAHVLDDWLVTSYYTDGVLIHDISRPFNMIEVGNFDTSPLQNTNMQGCWGVFPYFPSGLIVASDMEQGLYVLQPDYKLAGYLEGIAYDAANGNPLGAVSVQIQGGNQTATSDLSGTYATGIANSGNYTVNFSKPTYFTQSHEIPLTEGVVSNFNVDLVQMPSFPLNVLVLEEGTNQAIFDAQVRLELPIYELNASTNGVGEAQFILHYEDNYTLTAGKWGYVTKCSDILLNEQTNTVTIYLQKGWYDDFSFNFGWTTTSSASDGNWVRELPIASTSGSAPGADAPHDCGSIGFVTGNGNITQNFDEVKNGTVTLISPIFNLDGFSDPHVNYWTWFFNEHGSNPPDDTLHIFLSNGIETERIEYKAFPNSPQSQWVFSSIRVLDYLQPTSNMQIFAKISDTPQASNITEAGFDYFSVSNSNTLDNEQINLSDFFVYPNPSNGLFSLGNFNKNIEISISDIQGRTMQFKQNEEEIQLSEPSPGVYFVAFLTPTGQKFFKKIMIE